MRERNDVRSFCRMAKSVPGVFCSCCWPEEEREPSAAVHVSETNVRDTMTRHLR